ncbi:hypothetical protein Tco_0575544, partial [Tanacetum coccineum]
STLPTKGMTSMISMVSISLEDFLPFILLLMVIIVAVVIVTVIWVVIFIDVIVGVVIVVVMIIRIVVVVAGVSSIIKLSFVIIVDLIGDEDSTDEDGDIGVSVSLGDKIFSKGKESLESNIGDSDNTGNGGKTAGRAIITWGGGIALLISESEGTIVE